MEKYITFMLGKNLVFIDSFQFMNSSLENLAKKLPKDRFKHFYHEFSKKTIRISKIIIHQKIISKIHQKIK